MNNGLLYFGSFCVLVLAVLFGGPALVDWNGYRGVFEEEATKVLGREVRVGGGVNLRLLPTPYVRFEKIRIADVAGHTGEPFVRAESFTMRLAVAPLLRGALEANEIELNKPVLSVVLDGEGSGNWTTLKLRPGTLPFVPQNVALHSVRINDGALVVRGADGADVTRLDAVMGELSADSLEGPFKFKGNIKAAGALRTLKFATLPADKGGAPRFKASLQDAAGGNSYALDGTLTDFSGKPRISGELTGKIALHRPQEAEVAMAPAALEKDAAKKDNAAENPQLGEPAIFNLKSTLEADSQGAKLSGIELDLDGAAEPQLISGSASASWAGEPRLETALAAKWLDLDLIAAAKGETASLSRVKALAQSLFAALAGEGAGNALIDIEQVKLGGEQAGGLKIDAARAGGVMTIKELRGGLPGGARYQAHGAIKDQDGKPIFEGEGTIRGINLARVTSWAQKSGLGIDIKADGPFWAAGHISAGAQGFRLSGAKAEIAGHPLSGELAIEGGDAPRTAIRIEGAKLDTAAFFPAEAQRLEGALRRGLGLTPLDPGRVPGEAAGENSTAPSGLVISVLAGELRHEGKLYRDVDATLALNGADVRITSARFLTSAGVAMRFSGAINTAGAAPKGTLTYELDAPGREALQEAAQISGVRDLVPPARLASLNGAKLAGLIRLGARQENSADISFDGVVDAVRLAGEGAFDGGFGALDTTPGRLTANASAVDATALLRMVGVPVTMLKGIGARRGEAAIAISGVLSQGAQSFASIKAEGLEATLTGTLKHERDGYAFKGQAVAAARDAREALALAGLPAASGLSGAGLEGEIAITSANGETVLASNHVKAGSSILGGEVKFAGGDGPARFTAKLEADRVTASGLLGWIGERDAPAAIQTAAQASGEAPGGAIYSVWPEAPFNLDALGGLEGTIELHAGAFELAEGLLAREAVAEIAIRPAKVSLTSLKGKAAGGTLKASVDLEKVPGGVSLGLKAALDTDLAAVAPSASGRAAVMLEGTSRALSPASLIAALSGKGTVELKDVRHPGPAPAVVAAAGDAVLAGRSENETVVLTQAINQALSPAAVVAGSRSIPLQIVNGDVKAEPYTIETGEGSARVATIVSLGSLAVDSAWQVSARAAPPPPPPEAASDWKPAPKAALPAVSLVYTGSLGELAQLQVAVDASDLQRELGVRLMERKLEEADTLRKRDEERQRLELERRKAIDLERQQAAAAAAAARAQAAAAARAAAGQQNTGAPPVAPMPPVIPEAPDTPDAAPAPAPQNALPENDLPDARQQAATPPAIGAAPKASQVSVEPLPPADAANRPAGEAPQATGSADAGEVPPGASITAGAPRAAVPRPAPLPRPRRTTSDEINKAFGGWP